jgi:hypothetical protein
MQLNFRIQVPLWVECKAGSGRLSKDQVDFKEDVLARGGFYLLAEQSADPVMAWFDRFGVVR